MRTKTPVSLAPVLTASERADRTDASMLSSNLMGPVPMSRYHAFLDRMEVWRVSVLDYACLSCTLL